MIWCNFGAFASDEKFAILAVYFLPDNLTVFISFKLGGKKREFYLIVLSLDLVCHRSLEKLLFLYWKMVVFYFFMTFLYLKGTYEKPKVIEKVFFIVLFLVQKIHNMSFTLQEPILS